MPNRPKTPLRAVRVPDELWARARSVADARGETLSDVLRTALERYVRRHADGTTSAPPAIIAHRNER